MTQDDDQTYDLAAGPGGTGEGAGDAGVAMPDTGDMDTVMAAGARSGAAGVANPELGTSGAPAQEILTPEELAQTEITGGAGLVPDAVDEERLTDYFEGKDTTASD